MTEVSLSNWVDDGKEGWMMVKKAGREQVEGRRMGFWF